MKAYLESHPGEWFRPGDLPGKYETNRRKLVKLWKAGEIQRSLSGMYSAIVPLCEICAYRGMSGPRYECKNDDSKERCYAFKRAKA